MQLSSSSDSSDRHRIDLAANVRILSPGQPSTIWASTQNISEKGMFVVTSEVCSVDSELLCDVALPSLNLPVRGRVVWVHGGPRPGMGIEFLDLSEADLTALREAVASGSHEGSGQPVKIWMGALPQPIRAEAIRTAAGVLLRSELSFIKLGSPVLVYPAEAQGKGETYSGVLEEVSLTMNPRSESPVLLLHMRLTPQADPRAAAEAAADTEVEAPPASMVSPASPVVRRFGPDRICTPLRPAVDESEDLDLAVDLEPSCIVDESLLPEVLPEEALSEPQWELKIDVDPCERSYWTLEGPPEQVTAVPRRRRGHGRLWFVALLMLGITVGSMAYTGLLPRAQERVLSWLAQAGLVEGAPPAIPATIPTSASNESSVIPGAAGAPGADTESAAPAGPERPESEAVTNDDLEAPKLPAPASAVPAVQAGASSEQTPGDVKPGNFQIVTNAQGQKELVVLLRGSTRAATSYRLGQPDGVAFNLPEARPQVGFQVHRLDRDTAIRTISLRPREEGTQLRVLFWGSAPPYKVEVLLRQIRLTLLPEQKSAVLEAQAPSAM